MARDITQGGVRRGAWAGYLEITHDDFWEVVNYLEHNPEDLNIGWIIPDSFIDALKNNNQEALNRYKRALKIKLITGKGYFLFVDRANRLAPKELKDLNLKIVASNLCVTGDTKILTDMGYVPIESVEGTTQKIWDGKEWVITPIFKTSDSQKVLTVKLDNSFEIEATPYHRWLVRIGFSSKPTIKTTEELKEGDRLVKFDLTVIPHGNKELDLAYVNGFHSADGTVYKQTGRATIYLYDGKQTLLPRFSQYYNSSYTLQGRRLNLMYKKNVLKDKFFVPDISYSIDSRIKWLEGYFDGDGTLTNNNGSESIQAVSIELEFLQKILLMLQELGIHSTISDMKDAGYTMLPANDGTGENKEYYTKKTYRLLIAGRDHIKEKLECILK